MKFVQLLYFLLYHKILEGQKILTKRYYLFPCPKVGGYISPP